MMSSERSMELEETGISTFRNLERDSQGGWLVWLGGRIKIQKK